MSGIQTAQMKVTLNGNINGANSSGAFDFDEVTGGPEGMKYRMVGTLDGQPFEMYEVGGVWYALRQGQWYTYMNDVAPMPMGLGSLDDIRAYMEYAEDAEVTGVSADSYTIYYRLGRAGLERMNADRGTPAGFPLTTDMSYEYVVKIDRKTDFVTQMDMTLSVSDALQSGQATLNSRTVLVGFNAPVDIQLPQQAFYAQPIPEGF